MFGGCADCECGVSAIVGFARNDLGGGWGKSEAREEKSGLWTIDRIVRTTVLPSTLHHLLYPIHSVVVLSIGLLFSTIQEAYV